MFDFSLFDTLTRSFWSCQDNRATLKKYGQHITITKNNTACTVNTFHALSRCESHDDSVPLMR